MSSQTMVTHSMNLQLEYFKEIQNGRKIYEGRLYDEKRQKISIGDCIQFNCEDETVYATVTAIVLAETFFEGLSKIGFQLCIPNANTIEEALDVYLSISSYARDESKYGVVFYRLEIM